METSRRKRSQSGSGSGSGGERATEDEADSSTLTVGDSRRSNDLTDARACPVEHQVDHTIQYDAPQLPGRCYDPDTSAPISFYISSLEELKSWQPFLQDEHFNKAVIPLAPRQPPMQCNRPRTLVCHDMAGGYLNDRFIQGMHEENPFVFYHWLYIDIFVYFSHHMVTIPPVCWTNAAHKHGVAILGTFITEWKDGARICETFLENEESFRALADKLVLITHCFQFDGWLVNIENELSTNAVKNVPDFLSYFRTKMQQAVPHSLVIWYDSVLESGHLEWQNELNEHNKVFFDSCDGIFLNYNWTEKHLQRMALMMEGRHADIYVGVDVFGRGDVVGGEFTTNLSLELIRKYNFSAAIFAPGWVYETLGKENFCQNQHKFWNLLTGYLPSHSICTLPFATSFCQGFGMNLYRNGKVEVTGSWLNLSAQEIQPLFVDQQLDPANGCVKTHGCSEDAWSGGCCLVVKGLIPANRSSVSVRLFSLQVQSPPRVFVAFVYKVEDDTKVVVSPELMTCPTSQCNSDTTSAVNVLKPLSLPGDNALVQKFIQNSAPWNPEGWTTCFYLLELTDCILRDIFVVITRLTKDEQDVRFRCRIGEIKILDAAKLNVEQKAVENLTVFDILWRKIPGATDQLYLSATLQWTYPPNTASCFKIYCRGLSYHKNQNVTDFEPICVGQTNANLYRVVNLQLHNARAGKPARVEFLIQPLTLAGFTLPQSACGRLTLNYTQPPGISNTQ
ncbi:cytosolic endo-beta-N-acetylglucosaminidase [Rhincodon typus]|uniref:cytosolic endo-beta-N-acetylglucosaminidase n=1 Tax=Rhincodon typus TaxID=259920 RepID=UPI00202E83C6|nr:cytosolic endo-beta-N-acetylglucosaminidase [Rhincodon typus]